MKTHTYSNEAFSVYGFATKDECESLIDRAESAGFEAAPVQTSEGPEVISSARNNLRVSFKDKALALAFWERATSQNFPNMGRWRPIGLNEQIRIYRYDKHHMFRRHNDGAFFRNEKEESRCTFMVYLNDDFEGGATTFDDFTVWPQRGMAVCFAHNLYHEGSIVTCGQKYVLRTDVMYGAK
ncbi:MAG: 2OG-Fe(II) oxygenase [Pseudomonadota bacterium]